MQSFSALAPARLLSRARKSSLALPSARRGLSNPFGQSVRQEYGQDFAEDFLPEREAAEIEL